MRRPVPEVDSLNLLDVLDKYVRTKGVKAAVFSGPMNTLAEHKLPMLLAWLSTLTSWKHC